MKVSKNAVAHILMGFPYSNNIVRAESRKGVVLDGSEYLECAKNKSRPAQFKQLLWWQNSIIRAAETSPYTQTTTIDITNNTYR